MKKYLILILIMLLVVPIVFSSDFEVTITPVKDKIYKEEDALFNVTITNNEETEQKFKFKTNVLWNIMSEPLSDYFSGMVVQPGSSKTTLLKLSPPVYTNIGPQKLDLEITSTSDDYSEINEITVYIQSTAYGYQGYMPYIVTTLFVDPIKWDPREKLTAKVKLKNTNILNLSNVVIDLTTQNGLMHKKREISLNPLEERTEIFIISLSPQIAPGDDVIVVEVSSNGEVFPPDFVNIEIVSYSNFDKIKNVEEGFLKTKSIIEIFNDGNDVGSELYKVQTSLFRSIFTYTTPRAKTMREDGNTYLVWELVLNPSEKITITYNENYRSLLALVIIISLIIYLYFLMRSEVVIKKNAEVLKMEEGGISKIKITLNVRNRSKNKLEHIKLIEKIPKIAELIKEDYVGTLKPSKILTHDVKGTLLKWNIDALEGFEERMITYKIVSKLSILGTFVISPSVAKFKNTKGKITITHSNSYKLNI